ncbi:ComF family protein [Aquibacillus rhizosphaerae]|uniref:ComF family protein n=1 Tax=Aquibacillus rhizosphaerae TaxID=3051431 RepID=A0ABT7L069_9BACI|nr:ComF family protein [Aquibacillus sp. LR5S19]MDL4839214.1 ComF family protein [Aquibacillus sp. LR5S19]
MHCLWCEAEIIEEVDWINFFYPDKVKNICESCKAQLDVLDGQLCKYCGRRSEKDVCSDCERWESDPHWKGVLTFNTSVFTYNPIMKEIITKWKYRGDYALVEMLREAFCEKFNQVFKEIKKDAVIVPIPLSEERLYERAFNQAEALARLLEMPYTQMLTRMEGEKQSKKTRKDRLGTSNPFQLEKQINQPVILIDDIYTTGTTVRHAAKLLKENGCLGVYVFTLAR